MSAPFSGYQKIGENMDNSYNWNSRPLAERIRLAVRDVLELQNDILRAQPDNKDYYLAESITLLERLMSTSINEFSFLEINKSFLSLRQSMDAEQMKVLREVAFSLPPQNKKTAGPATVGRKGKRHD